MGRWVTLDDGSTGRVEACTSNSWLTIGITGNLDHLTAAESAASALVGGDGVAGGVNVPAFTSQRRVRPGAVATMHSVTAEGEGRGLGLGLSG